MMEEKIEREEKRGMIVLYVREDIPEDFYSFVADELNVEQQRVGIKKREYGPMAALEWMVPTGIVLYVTKSFFDAALKETGKDFYVLCKKTLGRLIKKSHAVKSKYIAADASPKKLSAGYDQSNSISVKATLHPNLTITVLFTELLSEEDFIMAVDNLFDSLVVLYQSTAKEFGGKIYEKISRDDLFLLANPDTRNWEIVTRSQMFERFKGLQD